MCEQAQARYATTAPANRWLSRCIACLPGSRTNIFYSIWVFDKRGAGDRSTKRPESHIHCEARLHTCAFARCSASSYTSDQHYLRPKSQAALQVGNFYYDGGDTRSQIPTNRARRRQSRRRSQSDLCNVGGHNTSSTAAQTPGKKHRIARLMENKVDQNIGI